MGTHTIHTHTHASACSFYIELCAYVNRLKLVSFGLVNFLGKIRYFVLI